MNLLISLLKNDPSSHNVVITLSNWFFQSILCFYLLLFQFFYSMLVMVLEKPGSYYALDTFFEKNDIFIEG